MTNDANQAEASTPDRRTSVPLGAQWPAAFLTATLAALLSLTGYHADRTFASGDVEIDESIPEKISYNQHIRGILSENCYFCHALIPTTVKPTCDSIKPEVIVRRMHLDLIGIPPTPAEVTSFIQAYQADANAAIDGLADRLLESPISGLAQRIKGAKPGAQWIRCRTKGGARLKYVSTWSHEVLTRHMRIVFAKTDSNSELLALANSSANLVFSFARTATGSLMSTVRRAPSRRYRCERFRSFRTETTSLRRRLLCRDRLGSSQSSTWESGRPSYRRSVR